MKSSFACFLFFAVAFLGGRQALSQAPKKAVFILLDGIPADVLERLPTPAIDEIAGLRGYTRAYVGGDRGAYNETPTISAPGYMSLLTAVWANKHNVWNNYNQAPNYKYRNIFRIVEEVNPNLVTAIFSTWLDNRTVLVGEGVLGAGRFRIDHTFDGLELDTLQYPHDPERKYILAIDERVAEEAAACIARHGPDLSWVYLEYPDDAGHLYGDSPELDDAVQKADRQVQRIWEAVKQRQAMGEDWMVVVTTDHGRDPETGKHHGGQSDRERSTWIATNANNLNKRFTEGTPAIVDITPSLLVHLGIADPYDARTQQDGIPFIRQVSLDSFQARFEGGRLALSWRPLHPEGTARIYIAFGNEFQRGGAYTYAFMGEAPVAQGSLVCRIGRQQAKQLVSNGFIKVHIYGPLNGSNYWVKME